MSSGAVVHDCRPRNIGGLFRRMQCGEATRPERSADLTEWCGGISAVADMQTPRARPRCSSLVPINATTTLCRIPGELSEASRPLHATAVGGNASRICWVSSRVVTTRSALRRPPPSRKFQVMYGRCGHGLAPIHTLAGMHACMRGTKPSARDRPRELGNRRHLQGDRRSHACPSSAGPANGGAVAARQDRQNSQNPQYVKA